MWFVCDALVRYCPKLCLFMHHIHTGQAPQYLSDCMCSVYHQFLHSVADTGWGRLAQRITFCQEQEQDLENEVSPTVAQPPGTLFLSTSTTVTPVHSENDSRVYFLIVLTTDYCWRSWTCCIAASYKFHVKRRKLIVVWDHFKDSDRTHREGYCF